MDESNIKKSRVAKLNLYPSQNMFDNNSIARVTNCQSVIKEPESQHCVSSKLILP